MALLAIGFLFSLPGATCAFLITYEEYLKHLPDKKRALFIALKISLITLAFFMLLMIFFAFISTKIF